ncbi:MAG: DUF2242 domain-containing protein [Betaproteobacteria bacterium HGW-Betaproteobacteria-6]|jgi:hypothetical protein|nr:MAG: DUF2242 domain-containing protein [Betaproteobacteria bacterium HGW-Betaproteobacteria-6]
MTAALKSPLAVCRAATLAVLCSLALSACITTKGPRPYQSESFASETPFQYYSNRDQDAACEIGKRALLSQGYLLDDSKPLSIRAEKFFRPRQDEVTRLTITLVCLPSSLGAVIYANALETQYEMKSNGSSAGVSVAALGSVSLPWSIDKDTLVKVGEETVTTPGFYERLFALIKSLDF